MTVSRLYDLVIVCNPELWTMPSSENDLREDWTTEFDPVFLGEYKPFISVWAALLNGIHSVIQREVRPSAETMDAIAAYCNFLKCVLQKPAMSFAILNFSVSMISSRRKRISFLNICFSAVLSSPSDEQELNAIECRAFWSFVSKRIKYELTGDHAPVVGTIELEFNNLDEINDIAGILDVGYKNSTDDDVYAVWVLAFSKYTMVLMNPLLKKLLRDIEGCKSINMFQCLKMLLTESNDLCRPHVATTGTPRRQTENLMKNVKYNRDTHLQRWGMVAQYGSKEDKNIRRFAIATSEFLERFLLKVATSFTHEFVLSKITILVSLSKGSLLRWIKSASLLERCQMEFDEIFQVVLCCISNREIHIRYKKLGIQLYSHICRKDPEAPSISSSVRELLEITQQCVESNNLSGENVSSDKYSAHFRRHDRDRASSADTEVVDRHTADRDLGLSASIYHSSRERDIVAASQTVADHNSSLEIIADGDTTEGETDEEGEKHSSQVVSHATGDDRRDCNAELIVKNLSSREPIDFCDNNTTSICVSSDSSSAFKSPESPSTARKRDSMRSLTTTSDNFILKSIEPAPIERWLTRDKNRPHVRHVGDEALGLIESFHTDRDDFTKEACEDDASSLGASGSLPAPMMARSLNGENTGIRKSSRLGTVPPPTPSPVTTVKKRVKRKEPKTHDCIVINIPRSGSAADTKPSTESIDLSRVHNSQNLLSMSDIQTCYDVATDHVQPEFNDAIEDRASCPSLHKSSSYSRATSQQSPDLSCTSPQTYLNRRWHPDGYYPTEEEIYSGQYPLLTVAALAASSGTGVSSPTSTTQLSGCHRRCPCSPEFPRNRHELETRHGSKHRPDHDRLEHTTPGSRFPGRHAHSATTSPASYTPGVPALHVLHALPTHPVVCRYLTPLVRRVVRLLIGTRSFAMMRFARPEGRLHTPGQPIVASTRQFQDEHTPSVPYISMVLEVIPLLRQK
ncbi:uncharacterized protein V1510DRAFT_405616 [Dipodascopsis tothii]|uniref:uncharacterized protein n=1 Tax=Dipodascopsis tothii TaxID=44089 RepID=UPI0034CEBB7D